MGFYHLAFANLCAYAVAAVAFCNTNSGELLYKDVVILGGGASGTYAAIRLQDLGKTVAVVEQKSVLGGHTNTYIDPETGMTVDYGVAQYLNIGVVQDFFRRLDIPYTTSPPDRENGSASFNFEDGTAVSQQAFDVSTAKSSWDRLFNLLSLCPYLENGFELPDPVPEDLVLPFRDFIKKHGLEDTVFALRISMGDVLSQPTLYVLKNAAMLVREDIRGNMLWTAEHNNQKIYDNALKVLGQAVFLSTRATYIKRGEAGITICLRTPTGNKSLRANKLLVTIPPLPENLRGMDVFEDESLVFQQFRSVGYDTSLVRIPGLRLDVSDYENVDPGAPFGLPSLPAPYRMIRTRLHELYMVDYGSLSTIPDQKKQSDILRAARALRDKVGNRHAPDPQIVRFDSHAPFLLHDSSDAIRSGFYRNLTALQGQHRTFWTGSAFHMHNSSCL